MKHSDRFFIQVKPADIERYGLYTALVMGYLNTASGIFTSGKGGKFYRTIGDIADTLGIGRTTVTKYLPTEEMGWKHYAGYKPGTMEKTTWWEPCEQTDCSAGEQSSECSAGEHSYNKEEYKEEENGRMFATLTSPAHSPSTFPLEAENGGAAQEEGGVVKITTPPDMVDLRKKQTANDKRKKEYEFCQELLARMGAVGVKAGGVFHKRITQLKAQGYDEETLRQVANEAKTARLKDDFYTEPMKTFSESGVSGLIARIEKRKAKKDDGWSEMERQGLYV